MMRRHACVALPFRPPASELWTTCWEAYSCVLRGELTSTSIRQSAVMAMEVTSGCASTCILHNCNDTSATSAIVPLLERIPTHHAASLVYRPLENWQIRILSLEPGEYGTPLFASLHHVDMLYDDGVLIRNPDRRISYAAISYCWGEHTKQYAIHCDEARIFITKEAHCALQRVRSTNVARYVWMDSVCIDQDDPKERASQVSKMLSIFKKAEVVVCWLGEHGKNTRVALAFLRTHSMRLSTDPSPQPLCYQQKDAIAPMCSRHAVQVSSGIQEIRDRPWFRRVWVRQEVWAARDVVVYCGDTQIPWKMLLAASRQCSGLDHDCLRPYERNPVHKSLERLGDILARLPMTTPIQHAAAQMDDEANPLFSVDRPLDIVNVLRRTAGTECSLAQDHIYSVLGMSSINKRTTSGGYGCSLVVSYEMSASEVFQRLAIYLAERTRLLTFLLLHDAFPASDQRQVGEDLSLPSWTPDWRRAFKSGPERLLAMQRYFQDCVGKQRVVASIETRLRPDRVLSSRGVLHLRGYRLGRVAELLHQDDHDPTSTEWPTEWPALVVFDPELRRFTDGFGFGQHYDLDGISSGTSVIECHMLGRAAVGDVVVCAEGSVLPLLFRSQLDGLHFRYICPVFIVAPTYADMCKATPTFPKLNTMLREVDDLEDFFVT